MIPCTRSTSILCLMFLDILCSGLDELRKTRLIIEGRRVEDIRHHVHISTRTPGICSVVGMAFLLKRTIVSRNNPRLERAVVMPILFQQDAQGLLTVAGNIL